MDIGGSGLGDTCSGYMVVTLIHSSLHLFEELIDVDQIILGAGVAHRGEMVSLSRHWTAGTVSTAGATNCHSGRDLLVLWHRAVDQRKLKAVEAKQTLADRGVRGRVELAPFEVTEELVQSVVAAFLGFVGGVLVRIATVTQRVVNISVRRVGRLLWLLGLIVLRGSMAVALTRHRIQSRLEVVCCSWETSNRRFVSSRDRSVKERNRNASTPAGTRQLTFSVAGHAKNDIWVPRAGLGGSDEDRIVRMSLHMLLQILRTLECLPTEVALVRLQGNVDTDMRGDVVTLDRRCTAASPLAGEVKVISALATDMALADVFLAVVSLSCNSEFLIGL